MMPIFITLLTLVLVLNCLLLILLVLIQLPKKEAGAGLAFGAGTTDALFGAGSGNALTKLTKYSAASFMILCVIVGVMNINNKKASTSEVRRALANQKAAAAAPVVATPAAPQNQFTPIVTPVAAPTNTASTTNRLTTNAIIAPATNRPAANTNAAAPR